MRALLVFALLILCGSAIGASNPDWREFEAGAFEQAREEEKLLILDLEAVWCHWCHVMHQTTYADEAVQAYLKKHYITLRADQDARPDLAQRYRRWGWPATIIFDAEGRELVKRAGYIAPEPMLRLLKAVVSDPTPETEPPKPPVKPVTNGDLPAVVAEKLRQRHRNSYDAKHGGLKLKQKFLDADSVEYRLLRAHNGDGDEAARVRHTLDGAAQLIDPVWGGVYQYSTHGDWQHAHYEKIMTTQARYIRLYAQASQVFDDSRYREHAEKVAGYLYEFLQSPEGAFYTSQDADLVPGKKAHDFFASDAERRASMGMPRIDKHIYARENGWAIRALAELYAFGGDERHLQKARRAAEWIHDNRALPDGGYRHDERDTAGDYLGDSLAMLGAWLALHRATGERADLDRAVSTADYILRRFWHDEAGFLSSAGRTGPLAPIRDLDENIDAARHLNLLSHYTGTDTYRAAARHALAWLATEPVALSRLTDPGILLAAQEIAAPPLHLAVVGPHDNTAALALYRVALAVPESYRRVEWWDRRDGPLPNPDVPYPDFEQPAGYVCTEGRCSSPAYAPDAYARNIKTLAGVDAGD